ncbi:MAG: ABC transporter ATP-binding protein [Alphaproteobacteria bacterium]|nr:ABC transporter ATP-binding protein [Alphaproteobacteria bacterium]
MAVGEAGLDLEIAGISKRFGSVRALQDCSLTVRRGEHMALLGPSGCGKSTLLNIIAGLDDPDAGELRIRGAPVADVPPNRRNIGVVFQSYALFPHLTLRENVAYGLKVRREPPRVAEERATEMIALLKLDGLEHRYPNELSGGQQQRAAIARALAIRPVIVLLDEALSALDKNLREEMQIELSLLLRRLGVTTILVTHDQREAFTIGDRIALMHAGRIVQVGTTEEVYGHPASSFVLDFLGSASALPGRVEPGSPPIASTAFGLGFELTAAHRAGLAGPVRLYLRAEDVTLSREPTAVHRASPARVELSTFLGALKRQVIELGGHQVLVDAAAGHHGPRFAQGDAVYLSFRPESCFVLPEGE